MDKATASAKKATESAFLKLQNKFGKQKAVAIVVAIVAAVLLLALLLGGSLLDSDKRYAVDIAKDYQSMLKDPESMTIRSDITIVRATSDEGDETVYCYFEVSAKNGFGGATSSVPLYEDGKYVVDVTDNIDATDLDNGDKVFSQFKWRMWQIDGFSEKERVSVVDGKSVADELAVPYYG